MFNQWRNRYVLMDAAAEVGEGGGGDGGGNEGAPANDGSLLAGAQSGSNEDPFAYIPEKLRVTKDDGTVDLDASSRKLAEVYANAEKRLGSGDAPPKAAEEYQVDVPEAFKESWKPEEDEKFKSFRDEAHKLGFNQKQLDHVMKSYFDMAPELVKGAAVLDQQTAAAELRKEWATDASFSHNLTLAKNATTAIAAKAGIDINEVLNSPLGNNPTFLKLMAALGPEVSEDRNPGGDVTGAEDAIADLMASEAYTNPTHKDHAKVSAQVQAHFKRKFGTEAAA